jgi:hypothetical protein
VTGTSKMLNFMYKFYFLNCLYIQCMLYTCQKLNAQQWAYTLIYDVIISKYIPYLYFKLNGFGTLWRCAKEGENVRGHCHLGQCLHMLVLGVARYIASSAIFSNSSLI